MSIYHNIEKREAHRCYDLNYSIKKKYGGVCWQNEKGK